MIAEEISGGGISYPAPSCADRKAARTGRTVACRNCGKCQASLRLLAAGGEAWSERRDAALAGHEGRAG